MKIICLGGSLRGFTKDTHADGPADLNGLIDKDEPVVLVCHGLPYGRSGGSDTVGLYPEVRQLAVHGLILTHRAHAAAQEHLKRVKQDLRGKCPRVFGLTKGWETLDEKQRARVLEFVSSRVESPANAEVKALLGFDEPFVKLALRITLEIALRELESKSSPKTAAGIIAETVLLSPALALAEQYPSLQANITGIKNSLKSGREVLREQVSQSLNQLR